VLESGTAFMNWFWQVLVFCHSTGRTIAGLSNFTRRPNLSPIKLNHLILS
jgi:hypothetical protein